MLELWNNPHFEEKKRIVYTTFKIFSTYICWINIQNATLEVSGAVSTIVDIRRLKFNLRNEIDWLVLCVRNDRLIDETGRIGKYM